MERGEGHGWHYIRRPAPGREGDVGGARRAGPGGDDDVAGVQHPLLGAALHRDSAAVRQENSVVAHHRAHLVGGKWFAAPAPPLGPENFRGLGDRMPVPLGANLQYHYTTTAPSTWQPIWEGRVNFEGDPPGGGVIKQLGAAEFTSAAQHNMKHDISVESLYCWRFWRANTWVRCSLPRVSAAWATWREPPPDVPKASGHHCP